MANIKNDNSLTFDEGDNKVLLARIENLEREVGEFSIDSRLKEEKLLASYLKELAKLQYNDTKNLQSQISLLNRTVESLVDKLAARDALIVKLEAVATYAMDTQQNLKFNTSLNFPQDFAQQPLYPNHNSQIPYSQYNRKLG